MYNFCLHISIFLIWSWFVVGCSSERRPEDDLALPDRSFEASELKENEVVDTRPPISAEATDNTKEAVKVKEIHVRDFGAVPGDGKNDLSAIREALKLAMEASPAKVVFESGRYILADEASAMSPNQFLALRKARDITLEGNGAMFELRNPELGFLAVVQSENIRVRNLSINYDPLPNTSGRIIEFDPADSRVRIELLPGHPELDSEPLQSVALKAWMCLHNPEVPGRLVAGANNFIRLDRFERVSPRVYDIYFRKGSASRFQDAPEGSIASIIGRKGGAQLFANRGNRSILYEGITVYSSPELVFVFVDTEGITLDACHILVPEGRFMSTNGDAFHAQNCRGPIRILNCTFEGQVDDAINIYSKMGLVESLGAKPGELVVTRKMAATARLPAGRFLKGDSVVIYDILNGRVAHETVVSASETAERRVQLASVPDSIDIADNERFVLFNQSLCRDVEITGNTLRNNRRFGVFLKASDVVIRDNLFDGMSGTAIMISYEKHYWEAGFSENVVIEENTFLQAGFEAGYLHNDYMGTITALPGAVEAFNGLPALDPELNAVEGIIIRNNLFEDPETKLILGYAEDIEVIGNQLRTHPDFSRRASVISAQHVRDLRVSGNQGWDD